MFQVQFCSKSNYSWVRVRVRVSFKGHKERTLINMIRGQKWSVILGMPWLPCHNPEID